MQDAQSFHSFRQTNVVLSAHSQKSSLQIHCAEVALSRHSGREHAIMFRESLILTESYLEYIDQAI